MRGDACRVAQVRFFSRAARVALTLLVAVPLAVFIVSQGFVVVSSSGDDVVAAELTKNYVQRQHLTRLPGGAFVGVPRLEGTVCLHCRDGTTRVWGYVTPGIPIWIDLSDRDLCRNQVTG